MTSTDPASRRLLIVDDEPDFADFVRKVAEKEGYAVEMVTDITELQSAYQSADPTLIILDLIMPNMDGVEVMKWLEEMKNTAPVFMISGYDPQFVSLVKSLASASSTFPVKTLRKPIDVAALQRAIAGAAS